MTSAKPPKRIEAEAQETADSEVDPIDAESSEDAEEDFDTSEDETEASDELSEETGIDLTDASELDADNVTADEEFDRVMQAPD